MFSFDEPMSGQRSRSPYSDRIAASLPILMGRRIAPCVMRALVFYWWTAWPVVHRDILAAWRTLVDLPGAGDLLLPVEEHLLPLGNPADGPGDGEEDREHVHRELHRLVDQAGVEIDVRVELALHEVLVLKRDSLQFDGHIQQRIFPGHLEDLFGQPPDDLGPGIVVLIDPVAKAHQPPFAGLDLLDVLSDFVLRPDLLQHPEDGLVGAAVQGTVKIG